MSKRLLLLALPALFYISLAHAVELKFNTQDFSPFSYLENGIVAGPASAIIRAVCQRIDVDCSFKLMAWKDAQQEVREGKAHGMFVIGWNRARADWLYFTPQIMQTEYGLFVARNNSLNYQEIRDLSGYTVGVYGPSNTATSLGKIRARMDKDKSMVPIQIDMRPDDVDCFKDLDSPAGTLTAVFSNRDVGNAIIKNHNLTQLRYAGSHQKLNYFLGFSKQFTPKKLVEQFNRAYIELYQGGQIASILAGYAMDPAVIDPHIIKYYTKSN